jgi:ABC-type transport system substrate-binding protein
MSEKRIQRAGLTRRSLIQATGTVTGGILLGTAASVDGDETRRATDFRTVMGIPPGEVQFNPRIERRRSPNVEAVLFDRLAEYDPEDGTFDPVLADSWSFSPASDSLEITIRDDYAWHEVTVDGGTIGGQPIDADDLKRQLMLDRAFEADYWDVVSDVHTTGSHTVRVDFDRSVNETILEFDILQRRLNHPPTYFDDSNYEPVDISPNAGNPPVGSGAFKFETATSETMTLAAADKHPSADRNDVSTLVFEHHGSESEQWAALADGEIEGTSEAFFPEQFRRHEGATPVDSLSREEIESDAGWGIVVNHRHPLLSDRRVRKAIAHVFSSADAVESMTDAVPQTISVLTGLSPRKTRNYLEGELGRFETYGDPKRAAELLGRAGFERTWEEWLDPRGGPATFGFLAGGNPHADDGECFAPVEPAWFYGARSFVGQLEAFLRNQEDDSIPEFGAELVQDVTGVGPHDDVFAFLPARQWGHFDGAHPYHTFRSDLLLRESANLGYGPTVEVPSYDDPTGPTRTVDVREKLNALREASAGSEERRIVRELAWIVNETVPYLQGYYRPSVAYVDDRFRPAANSAVGAREHPLLRDRATNSERGNDDE